jgi:hypothetical protein
MVLHLIREHFLAGWRIPLAQLVTNVFVATDVGHEQARVVVLAEVDAIQGCC